MEIEIFPVVVQDFFNLRCDPFRYWKKLWLIRLILPAKIR